MQYTALEYSDIDKLIEKVNKKIDEGWIPLGGVSTCENDYKTWYAQAMTALW